MVLTTAPTWARWAPRIRLAVLAVVAVLIAHTAIYAAEDGLGSGFASAMSRDGHGDWWVPASMTVLAAGMIVAARTLGRLVRLELRVRALFLRRRTRPAAGGAEARDTYRSEVVAIARRLLPLVVGLFAIQENLEQVVAHGRFVGFEALLGPAHPLALPILLVVGVAVSLVGGLVRWRISTLERRIRERLAQVHPAVAAELVGGRWRTIGALAPMAWMLDRLDAGRSPPIFLRP
jgi:hypothetical protein